MHTNPIASLVASFFLFLACGFTGAEEVPADHPMRQLPAALARCNVAKMLFGPKVTWSWSFTPATRRVVVGEPIWGRIEIKHTGTRQDLTLSPACNGAYVSTVGIWVGRWREADGQKPAGWSDLEQVACVNKNDWGYRGTPHQGKPVMLSPGQSQSWDLIINVDQPLDDASTSHSAAWRSGIGFREPGRYRYYLQYVNLENIMPFAHRNATGASTDVQRQGDPAPLPLGPEVLGPYEVEVVALPQGLAEPMDQLVKGWERQATWRREHSVMIIAGQIDLSPVLEHPLLKAPALASLRASLMLTDFRKRFSELASKPEKNKPALETLAKRIRQVRGTLGPGPVADAYVLSECHALMAAGKVQEGLQLAAELGTPDAVVLIEEEKERTARKQDASETP